MRDEVVILANGLTKVFGDVVAVDSVDFSVRRQECFGLLGPNGAGKTTTARMAACFIEPTSGSLQIFGRDVKKEPRLIKADIGVCPQENNLDPDLTVEDNLRVFARYFDIVGKDAKARCERLLHFVGLYKKRKSPIEELSGGMKRRLIIARSLVNSPGFLILDEPTTGLDPQARHQVWETIIALKKDGVTVLLTTHYMDEAAHLCDRIVIMDKGRIIISGPPKELIKQVVTPHVIEVSSAVPGMEDYLNGRALDYEKTSTHFFVYSRRGTKDFEEIMQKFGDDLCALRMANLEDVFLKLTGRELRD